MRKNHVYSMRMRKGVRDALGAHAQKNRCTVAALVDGLISNYLNQKGSLLKGFREGERRQHPRKKITLPSTTHSRDGVGVKSLPCVILNVSKNGALITYPKDSQIGNLTLQELFSFELSFEVPSTRECVRFECNTRRIKDTGAEMYLGATIANADEISLKKLEEYLLDSNM